MTTKTTLTTVLAGLLARPAFAHPGHGMAGWLHHGEVLVVAVVALAVVLAGRLALARGRTRRR